MSSLLLHDDNNNLANNSSKQKSYIFEIKKRTKEFYIISSDKLFYKHFTIDKGTPFNEFTEFVHEADLSNLLKFLNDKESSGFKSLIRFTQPDCKSRLFSFIATKKNSNHDELIWEIKLKDVSFALDFNFDELPKNNLSYLNKKINDIFSECTSLKICLDKISDYFKYELEVRTLEIWKLEPDKSFLRLYYHSSINKSFVLSDYQISSNFVFNLGVGLPGMTAEKQDFLFFNNLSQNPNFVRQKEAEEAKCEYGIGVPLMFNNNVWGTLLLLYKDENQVESLTKSKLKHISNVLASEIERKSQEVNFQMMFEASSEPILMLSRDNIVLRANKVFYNLFSEKDIVGESIFNIIVKSEHSKLTLLLEKYSCGESFEPVDFTLVNGNEIQVTATSRTEPDKICFLFAKDITKNKKVENLLNYSSKLIEIAEWEYNIADQEFYFSDKAIKMMGLSQAKLTISQFLDKVDSKEKFYFKDLFSNNNNEIENKSIEFRFALSNSVYKWLKFSVEVQTVEEKQIIKGCLQDIHKVKSTELELNVKTKNLSVLSKLNNNLLQSKNLQEIVHKSFGAINRILRIDMLILYKFEREAEPSLNLVEYISNAPQFVDEISNSINSKKSSVINRSVAGKMTASKFKSTNIKGKTKKNVSSLFIPLRINRTFSYLICLNEINDDKLENLNVFDKAFLISASRNISLALDRLRFVNQLEKVNQQNKYIIQSINDGFFSLDQEGKIVFWNRYALDILELGESLDDLIGRNYCSILNAPDFQDIKYLIKEALDKKKNIHFETNIFDESLWLEFSIYSNELGVTVIFKNITERKKSISKIKESNNRFQIINQNSNDAIWEWDIANDDLYWSNGFERIFGINLKYVIPSLEEWSKRIHPEDVKRVTKNLKNLISSSDKNKFKIEYRFRMDNGDYAYVVDTASLIRDSQNKPERIIGTITDISKQKRYEKSLKSLNKELTVHAKELEEINIDLEQFAYISSHDLQEPLRTITSFLTRLQDKYKDQLDEKASKYIQFSVEGAEKMRVIIKDLLQYSKATNFQKYREDFHVEELIESILPLYEKVIQEKDIEIRLLNFTTINSYKTPVRQVLFNLISNAIKYSSKTRKPIIEISMNESEKYHYISVKDNGIGFNLEYKKKVFSIFQRLHTNQEYNGSGIGLAVAKRIMDKIEGKIDVSSEEGKGSVFTLGIPK